MAEGAFNSEVVTFCSAFLNSALNDLYNLFSKVCDRKSSTVDDRSEFLAIKKTISQSFEQFEEKLVDREVSSLSSAAVLSRLNDLNEQFICIKQEMSVRFENLESKVCQVGPAPNSVIKATTNRVPETYAAVTKSVIASGSGSSEASARHEIGIGPNHGSNILTSRKQKIILSGSDKTSSLKAATRFPKRSAIFVSRLNQSTRAEEVTDFLSALDLKHLVCTKIKTKFNGYSSFHIEILESDMNVLLNAELWPEGCIVSKFLGRLRRDQIFGDTCATPDPSHVVNTILVNESAIVGENSCSGAGTSASRVSSSN